MLDDDGNNSLDLSGLCMTRSADIIARLPARCGDDEAFIVVQLERNKLEELSLDVVRRFASAQHLNLARNRLTQCAAIACLSALRVLRVEHNELVELPPSLGACVNLECIVADGNALTALPRSLARLKRLTKLSVASNRLCVLRYELSCALPSLRMVNLLRNPGLRGLAVVASDAKGLNWLRENIGMRWAKHQRPRDAVYFVLCVRALVAAQEAPMASVGKDVLLYIARLVFATRFDRCWELRGA